MSKMDYDFEVESKPYARTSQRQLKYYADFVRRHEEMKDRHSIRSDLHAKLWCELAHDLNQLGGAIRTPEEWKNGMRNWLKQLRHRVRKNRGNLGKISQFDREILEVFGETADKFKVTPMIKSVTAARASTKNTHRNIQNKENTSGVKFEFVDSIEETNSSASCSNVSIDSRNMKLFPEVFETESTSYSQITADQELEQGDFMISEEVEEVAQTPKKGAKYSTDEIVEMLMASLNERKEQEQQIVSILNKVGNQLLAAAEAINQLTESLNKK